MGIVYYDSFVSYVKSAADLKAKIARIDTIITALEDSALESAANQNFEEYQLDDGQSRIRTNYRSTEDIFKSINGFEKLRQQYINRLLGRQTRLVDLHSNVINQTGFRRR